MPRHTPTTPVVITHTLANNDIVEFQYDTINSKVRYTIQRTDTNAEIYETLSIGWEELSGLNDGQLATFNIAADTFIDSILRNAIDKGYITAGSIA
jgi:hypothetical protein